MGTDGHIEPPPPADVRPPPARPARGEPEEKPRPLAKAPRERDLRVDFMRGVVMLVLVVVHIELVSLFTFFAWERIGLISGGEGFVILSGVVLGMISRNRIAERGWAFATKALADRAAQLYRVNIAVIVVIGLLWLLPLLDMREAMTFTDRFAHQTYWLYPARTDGFYGVVGRVLLLRAGPHQIQILGLYVLLLFLTPAALWLLHHGRTKMLLTISFLVYLVGKQVPAGTTWNLTGANFENAFPLVNWQLLFMLGLATGWHREAVERFVRGPRGRPVFALAVVLAAGFFLLAQSTPNPVFPEWTRLDLVPPDLYNRMRQVFFDKNTVGLLRIVNYFAVLLVAYALLHRWWNGINRALGWFFVPLGQASLYVFVVHVFVVALVANFRPFGFDYTRADFVINTFVHAAALLLLWVMVKKRFLFRWIPR